MNYTYSKNIFKINKQTICFDDNILNVLEFDKSIFILTESDSYNIYRITKKNDEYIIIWQILNNKESTNKYIDIIIEDDNIFILDTKHFKYLFDFETGTIKHKYKPLDKISKKISTDVYRTIFLLIFLIFMLTFFLKFFENLNFEKNDEIVITETILEEKEIQDEEIPKIYKKETELEKNTEIEDENIREKNRFYLPDVMDTKITQNLKEKYPDSKYLGIDVTVDLVKDITNKEITSKYIECELIEVININKIKVKIFDNKNKYYNEEKIVKLISIKESKNNVSIDVLKNYLNDINILYLEQDIKKENNDYILGYLWLDTSEDLNFMVNYYLIHNKYATFEIQSPNILYNRFFK